jgi:glycosyltransferase involved in cell wall biosynthesis
VDPLKRVELIVRAFKKMPDKRLVVVSGGSDLPKIKKIGDDASNIHVLGWVDEATLEDLMGRCIGTIYIPRDEDFGISPVESMAAGKPVIGVQEGGVIETVGDADMMSQGARTVHGSPEERLRVTNCGILIASEPQEEDIMDAVKWLTPERARQMRASCERKARRFGKDVFVENMMKIIQE